MKNIYRVLFVICASVCLISCGSLTSGGDGGSNDNGSTIYTTTQASSYLVGFYWVETDDSDGTLNGDGRKSVLYITSDKVVIYVQDAAGGTTYTKSTEKTYSTIESWQSQANSFILSDDMAVLGLGFITPTQIWVWDDDVTDEEIFNGYSDVSELGITLSDG